MILTFSLTLPIKDPVLQFALLLFIILLAPMLLRVIRVPSIVGLILAGVAVGTHGFGLLEIDAAVKMFASIGLLYIMFLAGLEIDFRDFKRNSLKSAVFGFLTFSIPLSIGTITTFYYLGFPFQSSLLLASMYATHTLISYPIVSRLGVTKNEAVTITVGGTIITDTAALLLLSLITASAKGNLNLPFLLEMAASLIFFSTVVLWVFPKIARWFFQNIESEGVSQYIFTLTVVFASASLAEIAHIEPIIGAFLAGLALNRLIPHASPLMNRIQFVGNALFIPFFLIRVGMIVDLKILFGTHAALKVAATILTVAYVTKWLAAYITQQIFGYSTTERNIIFGLGSSHAAATLAIILIGFELKLFDESVMNGTILMILVTCIASTFITERAAKKLAIHELQNIAKDNERLERILVPLANPANFEQLLDLAILIKNPRSHEPIYPLSVVNDDSEAKKNILINNKLFEKAIAHAAATETNIEVIQRVDLNTSGGILRAIKDLAISDVVMGWNGKASTTDFFFGSIMTQLLQNTNNNILVSKVLQPINTLSKIIIIVPQNAALESGFKHWLTIIKRLSGQLSKNITFYVAESDIDFFKNLFKKQRPALDAEIQMFQDWDVFERAETLVSNDDLLLIVSAREQTVSYQRGMERLLRVLSHYFTDKNFVIIYPEQTI
jgi:Kef-type K+ transport system membrane component KefB